MMKIEGGCHCGALTYEALVNPDHVGVCHCTDCQILSGSAFRASVLALKSNFRLLTGSPKRYFKTLENGEKREQGFCGECGTSIYSAGVNDDRPFSIRVGTARQRRELTPKLQIWCRSALPWIGNINAITKIQEQPVLPK